MYSQWSTVLTEQLNKCKHHKATHDGGYTARGERRNGWVSCLQTIGDACPAAG